MRMNHKPTTPEEKKQATKAWMDALHLPHPGTLYIRLIGTNGKGSTGRVIAEALHAILNEPIGHFTSPHVHVYNERIAISGQPISDHVLNGIRASMRDLSHAMDLPELGYFEKSLVEALIAFQDLRVCVMEAGIGGITDATAVLPFDLNVFTTFALDHKDRLGATIEQVALNKAGVMSAAIPCVSSDQSPAVVQIMERLSAERHAPLTMFDPHMMQNVAIRWEKGDLPKQTFRYEHGLLSGNYESRMIGRHQIQNFGTGLLALETLLSDPSLRQKLFPARMPETSEILSKAHEGVARTYLPGRLEVISSDPSVLIDGAHNPQAVEMLLANLDALGQVPMLRERRKILIFGMHDGKLTEEDQRRLFSGFDAVVHVPVQDVEDQDLVQNAKAAMGRAFREHPDSWFVASGSLYLLDGVSEWVKERKETLTRSLSPASEMSSDEK